jgi:hypothetical protein
LQQRPFSLPAALNRRVYDKFNSEIALAIAASAKPIEKNHQRR